MEAFNRTPANVYKRARRILEIAEAMAKKIDGKSYNVQDRNVQGRIEEIQIHSDGYAEPGYSAGKSGAIATGNWNNINRYDYAACEHIAISDLPSRIYDLFTSMGIECEWSDEWSNCGQCNKLVRTWPDSYSYTPSYIVADGELTCHGCAAEAHLLGESAKEDEDDVKHTHP